MSLFGDILKGIIKNEVKHAKNDLEDAAVNAVVGTASDAVMQNVEQNAEAAVSAAPAQSCGTSAPSGFSWGECMPAEPNQYNFGGTYQQYFETVFREEFPEYAFTWEKANGRDALICTFTKDVAKALVLELMSEKSSAKKLRRDCVAAGIPYVRFYYNHDGWWNSRAYVVSRIKAALGA